MNILWISLYPPLPLNFGGPIGIYYRLKELVAQGNKIYLFYINEDKDDTYDLRLADMCAEVHSYPRNTSKNLSLVINCFRYPYTVATRMSKQMERDIKLCINENVIDLINVEFPQMCVNLFNIKEIYDLPIVLHEHNNEWNRFLQMASASKGIRKIFLKRESKMLFGFEKNIEAKGLIDSYSFLSTEDMKNHVHSLKVSEARTFLVPLGAEDKPIENIEHEGHNLVFCAAMDSEMNEEAALWFCEEVLPKITGKNVRIFIVGRKPSAKVLALQSERVIVTGAVDSLDYYYAIADAVVIPLLHGGGVKVKLLEAIGHGKTVITTPVGAEGTLFSSEHIFIAGNAVEFAEFCNKVIDGDEEVTQMRQKMVDCFRKHYLWSNIGAEYQKNLQKLL